MEKPLVALMLIPDLPAAIQKNAYYAACRDLVKAEGYNLINPLTYFGYNAIIDYDYMASVANCLDAIFVFKDFPISDFIKNTCDCFPSLVKERQNSKEVMDVVTYNIQSLIEDALKRSKVYFGIALTQENLTSKCRKREIVQTRQFLMKKIKENQRMLTLSAIGSIFGKDHATVNHALKTIDETWGMLESYLLFWEDKKPEEKKNAIDPTIKHSVIAELEMRKSPPLTEYKPPFSYIAPVGAEYSGYREHSR